MRRFLGAFHGPAIWERVERISEVAGERFRTRARFLQEKGWRAVLPAAADEDAGEVTLRPLVAGASEAKGVPVAPRERRDLGRADQAAAAHHARRACSR